MRYINQNHVLPFRNFYTYRTQKFYQLYSIFERITRESSTTKRNLKIESTMEKVMFNEAIYTLSIQN